jgi:hypothetical protein
MKTVSRRDLFAFATIAVGATVATTTQAQEIFVERAPPPPRVEVVPVLPPERAAREHWQPGYWRWNGHEHVWADGHYVVMPHPRAAWVPGRWEQRPRGWVFIEGHWT